MLLAVACTAMVTLAFLVPLGLVVREAARARAIADGERQAAALVPVLAIRRSLPVDITGSASTGVRTPEAICPPIRSCTSGAMPRYATWAYSMPARRPSMIPEKWALVPAPGEPNEASFGFALHQVMNSGSVRTEAGTIGLMARKNGNFTSGVTGVMSTSGS